LKQPRVDFETTSVNYRQVSNIGGAVMGFGHQTNTWGGVVGHPMGITSIKDLYYLTYGSDERALRDIAAAGYDGFEIFDGNLQRYFDDPASFERLVQETGLTVIAVYSGANFIYADCLDDEFARLEQGAWLGKLFGASYHVVSGGAIRADGVRDSDYESLARGLDRLADLSARYGLQAMFHPHSGTIVETTEQIHRLLDLTDIGLCPDTGHLLEAGADPVDIVRSFRDRISYVHFKDYRNGSFVPLGEGDVDIRGVVEALGGSPGDGWWTVELNETEKDKRAVARNSLQLLKSFITSK